MHNTIEIQNNKTKYLFEGKLQFREGAPAIDESAGKVGKYLGSGDGFVAGEKIRGTIKWDLFEEQGEKACDVNINGLIKTEDNAQIHFSVLGVFSKEGAGPKWHISSGVQFETTAKQYQWLNSVLGTWEGEFNMDSYTQEFQVNFNSRR